MNEDKRISDLKEVLRQYEEGAIHYVEFANWVTFSVTEADIQSYKELTAHSNTWHSRQFPTKGKVVDISSYRSQ